MTAEVNRLWKLIRHASSDLYLALGGNHPEVEVKQNMLKNQGILSLLGQQPNQLLVVVAHACRNLVQIGGAF